MKMIFKETSALFCFVFFKYVVSCPNKEIRKKTKNKKQKKENKKKFECDKAWPALSACFLAMNMHKILLQSQCNMNSC